VRARIGRFLRTWADRIDYRGAPRYTHWSFTFEAGEGVRFRDDKRGCPIAYLGQDDYARAHAEADTAQQDFVERHFNPALLGWVAKGAAPPKDAQRRFTPPRRCPDHLANGRQSPKGWSGRRS
jgi:hypothetical protein